MPSLSYASRPFNPPTSTPTQPKPHKDQTTHRHSRHTHYHHAHRAHPLHSVTDSQRPVSTTPASLASCLAGPLSLRSLLSVSTSQPRLRWVTLGRALYRQQDNKAPKPAQAIHQSIKPHPPFPTISSYLYQLLRHAVPNQPELSGLMPGMRALMDAEPRMRLPMARVPHSSKQANTTARYQTFLRNVPISVVSTNMMLITGRITDSQGNRYPFRANAHSHPVSSRFRDAHATSTALHVSTSLSAHQRVSLHS